MRNVLVAAVLATACEGAADAPNAGVEAIATDSAVVFLDRFDLDERIWYHDLPGRLDEVSGLAFTPDGRLFAHD
ncbi:MAG: hypothetical protein ACPHWZ_11970, partial [Longimicrobiales bacterium]